MKFQYIRHEKNLNENSFLNNKENQKKNPIKKKIKNSF